MYTLVNILVKTNFQTSLKLLRYIGNRKSLPFNTQLVVAQKSFANRKLFDIMNFSISER